MRLIFVGLFILAHLLTSQSSAAALQDTERPNFIIIFTDDQGFGDLGCYGSTKIKTPNLDQLAAEGRKFTSFYVPCSVCSPSRAALLTGCYPKRVGMHRHVIFPRTLYGLHPDEHTIADHLKSIGYATGCVGKWHLGHFPEILPRGNGFDSYFGIPYSNDMNHPDNTGRPPRNMADEMWIDQESALTRWNTPLVENEKVIEVPVDQRTITRRYTDKAIEFVTANKDQPFFLYLPHSMPHYPLYVPEDVYDPDPQNAYTCVIEHIDAEVGRLMKTVDELGLSDNTYVIFSSDNGPSLGFKNHGGSAGPLRDGKGTTFEGGQRVPCIIRGPGVPAGTTTNAFASTMDLLPTIAGIVNHPLPDRKIDGFDIRSTFTTDETPRNELIFYSARGDLEGIRLEDWKYLKRERRARRGGPVTAKTFLFNLSNDLGEQENLLEANEEKIQELMQRMTEADKEIVENSRPLWHKEEGKE